MKSMWVIFLCVFAVATAQIRINAPCDGGIKRCIPACREKRCLLAHKCINGQCTCTANSDGC
uniref:CSab-Lyc-16 n=1 Tax=Lychas buchari TaxID=1330406 RepID=T1DPB5_9SCOR